MSINMINCGFIHPNLKHISSNHRTNFNWRAVFLTKDHPIGVIPNKPPIYRKDLNLIYPLHENQFLATTDVVAKNIFSCSDRDSFVAVDNYIYSNEVLVAKNIFFFFKEIPPRKYAWRESENSFMVTICSHDLYSSLPNRTFSNKIIC